ncbi:MAG: hypothetical protein IJU53_14325 [Thermoguttaceae bacterium]|nr:hypothetical protein [Thermoguttaceae bacterium]
MKTLSHLLEIVSNKNKFQTLTDYSDFCSDFLDFIQNGLQAVIVCQNETNYRFFQYKKEANFQISRPINSDLIFSAETFASAKKSFFQSMKKIRSIRQNVKARETLNRFVYTCQQSIGAALDALHFEDPQKDANTARKIGGDLFERFVKLIIAELGIEVRGGVVSVPICENGKTLFSMKYQHDLILEKDGEICAIGAVKTSSKDRLDKIFIDKFLYNRLTGSETPHFAIFLNDVQKKIHEPHYLISATFLTGHFKGYTVKLTPLDGVYYCDLRPNMKEDEFLRNHIRTLDCLLVEDIWNF